VLTDIASRLIATRAKPKGLARMQTVATIQLDDEPTIGIISVGRLRDAEHAPHRDAARATVG
jgi:hypothetical protein